MQTIMLIIHVLLALAVIGLVLIQQGKGADAGAAFGSGASGTVFGAAGSGSFLTRMTTMCATLFFVTSLSLAVMAAHRGGESPSVMDAQPAGESSAAEGGGGDGVPAEGDGGDLPPIEE
jgi:preprotein translocase subunit SecG